VNKSRRWERLAVFGLGMIVAWLAFTREGRKPPFHDGPAYMAEPGPAAPLPGVPVPGNAMALLAEPKDLAAARVSSFARNGGNLDTIRLPLGGNEIVLADLQGPGAITHIWTTFNGGGRDIVLRFYWEGSDHPSIEAPIGDFFGVAMGLDAPVNSYPVQASAEGRARNAWWHMPFNRRARITAANAIPQDRAGARPLALYYYIDYAVFGKPTPNIHYLHARLIETDPAVRGQLVTLAEIEGRGHFVGLVMGQRARTPAWFGEGDDVITVDGKLSFAGTGTEDYFCDAWGFRVFSDLYHGVPVYEGRNIGDRLSAYRFHVVDPIPFRRSFKFEIEHWPWISPWPNTGRDYFSGLAFWYQTEVHKPWRRLDSLRSNAPWDPSLGRWFVPDALEAEDLAVLESSSRAVEDTRPPLSIQADTESRDILRSLLRCGPRPAPITVLPNLSGDRMMAFDSGGDGFFTLGVPAAKEGLYDVAVHYGRAETFGIVELDVNVRPAGRPFDAYLKTEELSRPAWPPEAVLYADVPLKAGRNAFRFAVRSKAPDSEGFCLGIDCIVLAAKADGGRTAQRIKGSPVFSSSSTPPFQSGTRK
jgi:hypothetical protein